MHTALLSGRALPALRLSLLAIVTGAALAACGGGGSSGSPSALQLGGVVVDGPIQGASVFLDLNNNLAHDPGEPRTMPTGAQGAFTLVAERLTRAQLATAMLVGEVPDAARDADDGGLTLAQAGRAGMTMLAPAAAFIQVDDAGGNTARPAVLSPLTTMVAAEMAFNGLTLAEARAAVQANLGLGSRDPMADFVAGGDTGMGSIARAAAIALGESGRAAAALAQAQGGAAAHEQIAAIMQEVRQKMPAVIHDLGLDHPGHPRPTVAAVAAALKAAPAQAPVALAKAPADGEQRYLVVFRTGVADPAAAAAGLMQGRAGRVTFTYRHALKGFAATVPAAAADAFIDAMGLDPRVDRVEEDLEMRAIQTVQSPATWGLDRADQRLLPLSSSYGYTATGTGVTAYVIDTGIRADHADFGGRVLSGFTAIADGQGSTDCHGHGTHVSGTIGGTTWGIAKAVSLVPVRVLDCAGSGTVSTVVAGIDWVVANAAKPAVINMSLGGGASSALDDAVANATAAGVTVVVAAGNASANACNTSPARAPSAVTIGATTSNDAQASYSNFGSCLDLYAPGSAITSAWYTSATASAVLSGTSMASPHVAGLAALVLQGTPAATPAQVTGSITAAATAGVLAGLGAGSPNLLIYTGTDGGGANPPPPATPAWVGALSGSATTVRKNWKATATITVVGDALGTPVAGAVISGDFSVGGSGLACTTGTNGTCSIASGTINKSAVRTIFTVRGISGAGLSYDASKNVASTVTIARP